MICPLKTGNPKICSEKECAWWIRTQGQCAILVIAVDLSLLHMEILEREEEDGR